MKSRSALLQGHLEAMLWSYTSHAFVPKAVYQGIPSLLIRAKSLRKARMVVGKIEVDGGTRLAGCYWQPELCLNCSLFLLWVCYFEGKIVINE